MQENNSQYNRYSNQVYDADELHPQKPSDNKKKKKDIWGYVLVSGISILLTASIFLVYIFSDFSKVLNQSFVELQNSSYEKNDIDVEVADEESEAALEKFNVVKDLLFENYYIELTYPEIIEAMTTGMLENLGSPYTYYLSPEDVAEMEESMSGVYSGIGATVEKVDTYFQV
ncbi:MAG: hypothetical protein GX326_04720, partial [Clostridiaceae bacterium]|nr:hypothetical protein [Clostridiaceae bacterium]